MGNGIITISTDFILKDLLLLSDEFKAIGALYANDKISLIVQSEKIEGNNAKIIPEYKRGPLGIVRLIDIKVNGVSIKEVKDD